MVHDLQKDTKAVIKIDATAPTQMCLIFNSYASVILTFDCFTTCTQHWRKFNDIQSCASEIKKLQSYNGWLICAYNHLMWCEEITVRLGSLKIVSEGTETHQSGK